MVEFKHRDYEAALAGFRFFLELYGKSLTGGQRAILAGRTPIPTRALQRSRKVLLPCCVLLPTESEACDLDLEDQPNLYKAEGS
jgi:hypothetical protein